VEVLSVPFLCIHVPTSMHKSVLSQWMHAVAATSLLQHATRYIMRALPNQIIDCNNLNSIATNSTILNGFFLTLIRLNLIILANCVHSIMGSRINIYQYVLQAYCESLN
jgi:hypothetical protein